MDALKKQELMSELLAGQRNEFANRLAMVTVELAAAQQELAEERQRIVELEKNADLMSREANAKPVATIHGGNGAAMS